MIQLSCGPIATPITPLSRLNADYRVLLFHKKVRDQDFRQLQPNDTIWNLNASLAKILRDLIYTPILVIVIEDKLTKFLMDFVKEIVSVIDAQTDVKAFLCLYILNREFVPLGISHFFLDVRRDW
jgi:hypothetical protein